MSNTEKSKTRKVLEKQREAKIELQVARSYIEHGDMMGASSYLSMSRLMERESADIARLDEEPQVSSGEVIPTTTDTKSFHIKDTLKSPDSAAVDASIARTDLLLGDYMDIAALAVDAANSIDAKNSLEKMLAHQLAAAHKATMEMMSNATSISKGSGGARYYDTQRSHEAENLLATRLYNSASRMMKIFQQGLLTLQRLRNGGNQTVTVQHVQVSDGGQAVIGNVGGGITPLGTDVKKGNTP